MFRRRRHFPEVEVEESYLRDMENYPDTENARQKEGHFDVCEESGEKADEDQIREIGTRARVLFVLGKDLAERLEKEGMLEDLIRMVSEKEFTDGEIVSVARELIAKKSDLVSELVALNSSIDPETARKIYEDYTERLKKIFSLGLSRENTEAITKEILERIDFLVTKLSNRKGNIKIKEGR